MTEVKVGYDISRGNVRTSRTRDALSKSRVEQVIERVYDEFSGDAPIQQHLVEFSAWHQHGYSDALNVTALKQFEYLKATSLDEASIRTKGLVALNMIRAEIDEGELSAYLVEPFEGITILPTLYRRWLADRSGWAKPPLYL